MGIDECGCLLVEYSWPEKRENAGYFEQKWQL